MELNILLELLLQSAFGNCNGLCRHQQILSRHLLSSDEKKQQLYLYGFCVIVNLKKDHDSIIIFAFEIQV